MSLKLRLMLIISALIVLLLAAANVASLRRAEEDSLREIEATTRLLLALLPNRFAPDAGGDATLRALEAQGLDRSLRDTRHVVVEVHARGGQLIWTSQALAQAAEGVSLFARSSRLWNHPAARKDIYAGDLPVGYFLVRPNPADELREIQSDYLEEAILTCAVAVLLCLAVYATIDMVLRPLGAVRQGLAQLRAGNLDARMPAFALPELRELADSFNHTAQALDEAVAQRQRLMHKLVGLEEGTRRSIARDLHDELSPYLVAMQPHARLIADACERSPELAPQRGSAQSLLEHLSHLLRTVRNLLERLRPPEIEELGLRNSLDGLIDQWRRHGPRPVNIRFDFAGEWNDAPPTLDLSIYRIVQECLTNSFKHSDATRIEVDVGRSVTPGRKVCVHIRVADNGASRATDSGSGLGVLGMRERVAALGGSFEAGPAQGGGWRVEAMLPEHEEPPVQDSLEHHS